MEGSGALSSGYEDTGPSGSSAGSITVTPASTLVVSPATSITASTQTATLSPSGIKARSMAVYSSTTAVSETVEPMSGDVPDKTSLVTKAHFLAFIIIPILSFVFVIMVIVLIVGIVKLKKGDRQKRKVITSPDKIEGK